MPRLFGGLLSRAMIDNYDEPAGPIIASPVPNSAASTSAPAPVPAPEDSQTTVINPEWFYAVDVWGQIVPDAARWDDNRHLWGSTNGQTYTDLIDTIQQEYDYNLSDDDAKVMALRRYPRAADTIARLGLRNWWILGTDAQFGAAWQGPSVVAPAPAPAPAPWAPVNDPENVQHTGIYPWTPQATVDGQAYVPEAPPVMIPLAPQTPLPAAPAPAPAPAPSAAPSAAPSTSSGGLSPIVSPVASGGAGWIDNGNGGVSLTTPGNTAAPVAGNGGKLALLGILAALAYFNS